MCTETPSPKYRELQTQTHLLGSCLGNNCVEKQDGQRQFYCKFLKTLEKINTFNTLLLNTVQSGYSAKEWENKNH